MKQKILLLLTFICLAVHVSAQDFPEKPNHLVNDYTGTLSTEEAAQLEQKLVTFDDSTSTQIAVVLIKSLGGYDIADYTARLAEKWGVGGKKNNNGVMILAALDDRKVTIQTGYGVEGVLPDAIANRIIENEIKPEFKQGNYYEGLDRATDAVIAYTKGEYKNDEKPKDKDGIPAGAIIIIIIVVIFIVIAGRGGGGGGRGRVIGSGGAETLFWWSLLSGMGRGNRGGGFGGGGFGGGFGGSGSGGGGFGGFGGGRFGGGGASGGW